MSRVLATVVVCSMLSGCASTPVGQALPQGGLTTFVIYAPENSSYGIKIYSLNSTFPFARDAAFDNHAARPAQTPTSYVAYTAKATLAASTTYYADLMAGSYETGWQYADAIDPFSANELILVEDDD